MLRLFRTRYPSGRIAFPIGVHRRSSAFIGGHQSSTRAFAKCPTRQAGSGPAAPPMPKKRIMATDEIKTRSSYSCSFVAESSFASYDFSPYGQRDKKETPAAGLPDAGVGTTPERRRN
ncbi:MAG TPA: hypothetical protein VN893_15975 [Bryobacteraceae bacterium]|nr:hypothetical protein [Bryobacteraceae bacterium]